MEHHNNPTQEASLKQSNASVLKKLFFSTLYLSTFTFGGGYVIVSLLKTKFVDELHWIDETEMLDLIAIAQSSPGAIAVNGAIVVGYKLAGMPGILCSILGAILPPFVNITAVSAFYNAFRESFFIQKNAFPPAVRLPPPLLRRKGVGGQGISFLSRGTVQLRRIRKIRVYRLPCSTKTHPGLDILYFLL